MSEPVEPYRLPESQRTGIDMFDAMQEFTALGGRVVQVDAAQAPPRPEVVEAVRTMDAVPGRLDAFVDFFTQLAAVTANQLGVAIPSRDEIIRRSNAALQKVRAAASPDGPVG